MSDFKNSNLNVFINDDGAITAPYFTNDKETISQDFANFLEESIDNLPLKTNLTLTVNSNKPLKNDLKEKISNYYQNKIEQNSIKLKRITIASFFMLLIGALLLTAYITLHLTNKNFILLGVTEISSWVFIWESVDIFFFKRKELKLSKIKYVTLLNSTVNYTQNKA